MLGAGGAGVLAGCSSSPSTSGRATPATTPRAGSKPGVGTGTPVQGGSLTIGTIAEIDGFYPPTNHWDTNGFLYANTVYDPLMAVAADGTSPALPGQVHDQQLHLRHVDHDPAVRGSSSATGRPDLCGGQANFTALEASALTGTALDQVDPSVTTPDAMTVVYNLTGPNPTFPPGSPPRSGYVVGQAMIGQATADPARRPNPDRDRARSSTPAWQPNDHFTATRNPNYWRTGLPYLDQITFKPIPDDDPAGVHPPDRWGRPDPVDRSRHHHQLRRVGSQLPVGRHASPVSSVSRTSPSSC